MTDIEIEKSCEIASKSLEFIAKSLNNNPYTLALNAQMIIIDQLFTDSCERLAIINKINVNEAIKKMSDAMIQSSHETLIKDKEDPADT